MWTALQSHLLYVELVKGKISLILKAEAHTRWRLRILVFGTDLPEGSKHSS